MGEEEMDKGEQEQEQEHQPEHQPEQHVRQRRGYPAKGVITGNTTFTPDEDDQELDSDPIGLGGLDGRSRTTSGVTTMHHARLASANKGRTGASTATSTSTSTTWMSSINRNKQQDDDLEMLGSPHPRGWPAASSASGGSLTSLISRASRRPILYLTTLIVSTWLLFHVFNDSYTPNPSSSSSTSSGLRSPLYQRQDILVTLASSAVRLRSNELAITLRSLLKQHHIPQEIRVYLPESDRDIFNWHKTHDTSRLARYLRDERVKLNFVEDVGPSTKFFYAIQGMLLEEKYDQPIVVVDDDHSYSPDLISSLVSHSQLEQFKDAAVGLRGWRVRKDLHWGVAPEEMDDHIAEGWRLLEPFRVGVLTANEGYLIRPRFFVNRDAVLDPEDPAAAETASSTIADNDDDDGDGGDEEARANSTSLHNVAPILDKEMLLATSAHLVDDIWINGHLARTGTPRYVVPLRSNARFFSSLLSSLILSSDAVPSIDVTKEHTLEGRIRKEGQTRATANWATLRMFEAHWRGEKLFYVTLQERKQMMLQLKQGEGTDEIDVKNLIPRNIGSVAMARRRLLKLFHHLQIRLLFGQ